LKLDLQGAEMKALTGARKMLGKGMVSSIFLEVIFVPLYEGQATFDDIIEYLYGFNYGIFGFYDLVRSVNGRLKWCDVLFFKDSSEGGRLRHSKVKQSDIQADQSLSC
jgi:hypothetical protein